ncbi:hypothetical protein G9A89_020379 [Geosiphon pyriformis]|nr:hypothetical protein G9A89_020379 [Geosiphon pyriformis]
MVVSSDIRSTTRDPIGPYIQTRFLKKTRKLQSIQIAIMSTPRRDRNSPKRTPTTPSKKRSSRDVASSDPSSPSLRGFSAIGQSFSNLGNALARQAPSRQAQAEDDQKDRLEQIDPQSPTTVVSDDSSRPSLSAFNFDYRSPGGPRRGTSEISLSPSASRQRSDIHPLTPRPSQRPLFETTPEAGREIRIQPRLRKGPEEIIPEPKIEHNIWGTLIDLVDCKARFLEFIGNYTKEDKEKNSESLFDDEAFYPKYLKKISINDKGQRSRVNLDVQKLLSYPKTEKLYHQLQKYPHEIIPMMDNCITEFYKTFFNPQEEKDLLIRPFNMLASINMRDLNPSDIDQLVSIKGLLIRTSPVIPDMRTAFFRCYICGYQISRDVTRGKLDEPTRCLNLRCNSVNTMELIHNRCTFSDRQVCRLQETPDAIPDGQTPHTVTLYLYDDLVDVARPGDRLEITGIFRSVPIRIHPRQRTLKSLFKTYIDVVHVRKTDQKRLAVDSIVNEKEDEQRIDLIYDETDDIPDDHTQEDEQRFIELSRDPNLYDILARSLAPSIYELDDVKKGILLQLFGGTNKKFQKLGAPRYRGDINVLLVGDPGTSKSQILQYVHKIAPRGVYTSGKGSSAVGLTAYVTRDPDSRQLVLESGALVLSDGGICCIDEFDKMSDGTRSVLHEVMEQQTISVAKAGIITTLNARTSILASANPVNSKYNPKLSIVENIQLPPTLMSRFDLIYLILDKVDEFMDRRLAQHLVSLYFEDAPETAGVDILPVETLTGYISYARQRCDPSLSVENDDAYNALIDAYLSMRKMGQNPRSSEKIVTATTRQLESLIRLSEAHARMRLSDVVDVSDVEEAVRLLREAIKQYAVDPETGRIDMDLINTGRATYRRHILEDLRKEILNLLLNDESMIVAWKKLLRDIKGQSSMDVHEKDFEDVIRTLEQEGEIRFLLVFRLKSRVQMCKVVCKLKSLFT